MWAHAPPELRGLVCGAGRVEEAHVVGMGLPRAERVGHAAPREEACEHLRARRMEAGVDALVEGRARRDREELRQPVTQRVDDLDRAIGSPDRDVRVEAEGVVAPHDVAEQLVVPPVVRRIDDALIAPARPGVGSGRAEGQPEWLDERRELGAPLGERRRNVRERLLLPCLDLHLGGDELADEVRLETRAANRLLHVLEAVDEVERLGVEEGELLLDRDREVHGLLEALVRLREEPLVGRGRAHQARHSRDGATFARPAGVSPSRACRTRPCDGAPTPGADPEHADPAPRPSSDRTRVSGDMRVPCGEGAAAGFLRTVARPALASLPGQTRLGLGGQNFRQVPAASPRHRD